MRFCVVTTFYPPHHFAGDSTLLSALPEDFGNGKYVMTIAHCDEAFHLAGTGGVRHAS